MNKQAFLIFSGHNDRAVFALCRFFSQRKLPFIIAASGTADLIFQTPWAAHVTLTRPNKVVDQQLFAQIAQSSPGIEQLIYCPTTEYINDFILNHRKYLEGLGFQFLLPSQDIYHRLSNKKSSLEFIEKYCALELPREIPWGQVITPCVFKPKENISNGEVHYPVLCFSPTDAKNEYSRLNPEHWFAQRYIQGQSHYLCAYLSRDGHRVAYWQTNLMQQAGGKSIVLAKTGENPGFDEDIFFQKLTRLQYFGPLMMEILQDEQGNFFYIEINPRFWGPLQLAVDAYPEMLDLFAADAGFVQPAAMHSTTFKREFWYAWAEGAQKPECHLYPAADALGAAEIQALLTQFDVYKSERNLVQNENAIHARAREIESPCSQAKQTQRLPDTAPMDQLHCFPRRLPPIGKG